MPQTILKEKTFSPKRLRDALLLEYNIERKPQAVSMWLKRHPQVVVELKEQIGEIDAQHENIRFEHAYWFNDFHSKIPVIQQWIDTLLAGRKTSKTYIKSNVNTLRKMCMGMKGRDGNLEQIKEWKLHPLAFTEERALEYLAELNRLGYDDQHFRLVARNFLKFAIGKEPQKISGEKTFGKYGHIYATKEKLTMILAYIQARNYKIYVYCKFMFKTATRTMASKMAKLGNLNEQEKTIVVFDKGRKGKKQKWIKHLDNELLHDLQPLIEKGRLFEDIDVREVREICREAYRIFIPELAKDIPFPLHFWRHMFAQHMLRATNWNYTLVAMLGGWKDEKTLKDNYGIPPKEVVKKWGLKYVPMI